MLGVKGSLMRVWSIKSRSNNIRQKCVPEEMNIGQEGPLRRWLNDGREATRFAKTRVLKRMSLRRL